jgi:molecular chaperone GrpE
MQETEKKETEIAEEPVNESVETPCEEKRAKKEKKEKKSSVEERLKAELERAEAESEDLKRKWYAVTAEYENYRRRTQNQSAQRYAEGRNDVVASLFPIGDNLERALSACADENVKQGLDMVLKSFKKVLEGEGVEEIDPVGQPFDADVAEAIMAVPAQDGEESGIVKQVYVKGYKKGDKVLRYAQVIVTQ